MNASQKARLGRIEAKLYGGRAPSDAPPTDRDEDPTGWAAELQRIEEMDPIARTPEEWARLQAMLDYSCSWIAAIAAKPLREVPADHPCSPENWRQFKPSDLDKPGEWRSVGFQRWANTYPAEEAAAIEIPGP